jgi:hypothetical protein
VPGRLRAQRTRWIDGRRCWVMPAEACRPPLGEPAQGLRVEVASSAGAAMGDVDMPVPVARWTAARRFSGCPCKTDDLIVSLEDEPVLGGAEPHRCGQRSHQRSGVDFATDGCVLQVGAANRQARGAILC